MRRASHREAATDRLMQTFQSLLAKKLSDALANTGLPAAGELTQATDPRFGDYQTNVALVLGKQRGENPRALAEKIIAQLDVSDVSEPPVVAGAGFINFTLRSAAIEKQTLDMLQDEQLGVAETESPRRIVIDFGSPNVAKPMHVGHIRSTVLGDSLARVAEFLGHKVIRDNHIGDWGTQFGVMIWGWKNFPEQRPDEKLERPIAALEHLYKLAYYEARAEHQEVKGSSRRRHMARSEARDAAREELVKLQQGDPENVAIWKKCVELSMREFSEIYKLLDVHYDLQCGESFYNDRLPGVVDRLLKAGIAEISERAVVVFFRDDPELTDKPLIICKQDGGFNYATTDLATIDYRVNDRKADAIWYVVGAPQTLHFKQIFAVARREGYTTDLRHIIFGSVLGEDRKLMKTRSGESVPLRELLEEACKRARKIIDEKNPDLSEDEKNDIAEKIGIGAVKYADLSQYRTTDYVFSWDKMLSLHGNTAPYLQNAYVRIRSIFRKAGESTVATPLWGVGGTKDGETGHRPVATGFTFAEPAELNLAKRLCQFAEIVPQVLNGFRPNILANYLFELANSFHAFYEACPVLKSEEPTRSSRLLLCELTGRVLQKGLELLGIKAPEKM
jgi:arginyl-tRNA synthetase